MSDDRCLCCGATNPGEPRTIHGIDGVFCGPCIDKRDFFRQEFSEFMIFNVHTRETEADPRELRTFIEKLKRLCDARLERWPVSK